MFEDLLPRAAIAECGKIRLLACVLQWNNEAFDLPGLGGLGGSRDANIGESRKCALVGGKVSAGFCRS